MAYSVRYRKRAVSYLKRLTGERREKILDRIERLAEDPFSPSLGVKRLAYRPAYRLRAGAFRIIFELRDGEMIILVVLIRPRGDVYKR